MQLTTFLGAASALVASTSATAARSAVTLNDNCNLANPHARIVNRCDYDVYLWSVFKGDGCPTDQMVVLKSGESYAENYDEDAATNVGISIKLSKTKQCKDGSLTQLEYYRALNKPEEFRFNYLDVSYVDCEDGDCPARQDGYYLVAGDQKGKAKASAANTWCPILSCSDKTTCDSMSYVLPDDVQTKTCQLNASINFYMCGSEAPNGDDSSSPSKPKPKPSSSASPSPSKPESSSSPSATSTKKDAYVAAVTPSPSPTPSPTSQLIKTEVVYVTEYVNAKRHAHDHARRHQAFRA